MGPVEIAATAQHQPWYVLLAVGIFFTPILIFMVWKWFLHGKAENTVAQMATTQGSIYQTTMADANGIITELRNHRDALEKRESELIVRLADMSDRIVDMQAVMGKQTDQIAQQQRQIDMQTDQIALQSRQIVTQAEQLEAQALQIEEATRTIKSLTALVAKLESNANGNND